MPKSGPQYVVRSERGRFTLIASPKKRGVFAASTDDAHLTVPMRIAAILGGLVFAALGFGLTALIVHSMLREGISALLWMLGLLVVPLLIAGYGLDLVGRGILGRPWLMLFGGLATYAPVRRTRQKDLWIVAAGPLANLLASALVMGVWDGRSDFLGTFLACFLWLGIAMALLNLIPFPRAANGFALDGRELLDLLRGGAQP